MTIKTVGSGGDYATMDAVWDNLLFAQMDTPGEGLVDDYAFRLLAGSHAWDVGNKKFSGANPNAKSIIIEPDPSTRSNPPIMYADGSGIWVFMNNSTVTVRDIKIKITNANYDCQIFAGTTVGLVENCIIAITCGDPVGLGRSLSNGKFRNNTIIFNYTIAFDGKSYFGNVYGDNTGFHNNIICVKGGTNIDNLTFNAAGTGHKNNLLYDFSSRTLTAPAEFDSTVLNNNPLFQGSITWTNSDTILASNLDLQEGSPARNASYAAETPTDDIIGRSRA